MKQQTHDKLNVWRSRKKSEPQMGFESMTLREPVGCSNDWATGDSMVSKGQFMGLTGTHQQHHAVKCDSMMLLVSSCVPVITWQHHAVKCDSMMLLVSSCVPVITWLCSRVMRFQSRPINWPLLTIESPVAQWLEHPTRSRRVVGSKPI